jgi:hypothetical protein
MPVLAISQHRIIVAAGDYISSYLFGTQAESGTPPVIYEGSCSTPDNNQHHDISSCRILNDETDKIVLLVGYQHGLLRYLVLSKGEQSRLQIEENAPLSREDDVIQTINGYDNLVLWTTHSGKVYLNQVDNSWSQAELDLDRKLWKTHLCMTASTPYVAIGGSKPHPLNIHAVTEDGIAPHPIASLETGQGSGLATAVYGLTQGPISSPWGASPQVLVSGWYDGYIRCYDLRASLRGVSNGEGPAKLRPVMRVADRMSLEPIYSVSCGGGSSAYIAAGAARHSVVSFWDVRAPKQGWSVYAPGNDASPVYDVVLESSRLYGTTQSRSFLLDFVSISIWQSVLRSNNIFLRGLELRMPTIRLFPTISKLKG